MRYPYSAIADADIPHASRPIFQHVLDTYASESNKTVSVWQEFSPPELPYRPHSRSSTVEEIMKHQLLSERRFFGEFLGTPEPSSSEVLPQGHTPNDYARRLYDLARPRLDFLAPQIETWWLARV